MSRKAETREGRQRPFPNGNTWALPTHVDAERWVLGSVLLKGSGIYLSVSAILKPEDFSLTKHQIIFRRMGDIANRGEDIDRITVADELMKHSGEIEICEGLSYLVSLDDGLPDIPNIDHYVRMVANKSALRKVIMSAQVTILSAASTGAEPGAILSSANATFMKLTAEQTALAGGANAPQTIAEIIDTYPGGLNGLCGAGLKAQGIPTGFVKLDDLTGGLHRGELFILGARPSMGKTALCLDVARNVAGAHLKNPARAAQGVFIFSKEMTKEALLVRMLCQEARVDSYAFRANVMNAQDRERILQAAERLVQMPIMIDDRSGTSVPEMHLTLQQAISTSPVPIALGIVDYLGLVPPVERSDNRAVEVGFISRGLKRIAKELDLPMLVLCQLSRACEARHDKRPILADLRESGEIEADADIVAFIFREEVYKPDREDLHGVAELLIRKQRNGPLGLVNLVYIPKYTRFENLAEHY